ncbi:MAG: hypothetical protein ABIH01_02065 [Candidatus Omnitrophota bacterium]
MKKYSLVLCVICLMSPLIVSADEPNEEQILSQFRDEPTIAEIRKQAMKFAEVEPQKIQRWRKQAQAKAMLPKVSLDFDDSTSNTYEIYTSLSKDYIVAGPDDRTRKWGISLSWDLGEIIWNDDQTGIDVRSRLMVQLREDILEAVTRYYFDRRRVQIDMALNPPQTQKEKIEKELKLQELTANIDALTGGYLSRAISKNWAR